MRCMGRTKSDSVGNWEAEDIETSREERGELQSALGLVLRPLTDQTWYLLLPSIDSGSDQCRSMNNSESLNVER